MLAFLKLVFEGIHGRLFAKMFQTSRTVTENADHLFAFAEV